MTSQDFKKLRGHLGRTQKDIAGLLGVSIKAIHSYEQGWRKIPGHIERQMLFLLSRSAENPAGTKQCWDLLQCPEEKMSQCPAWEFKSGDMCWFVNGTQCGGKAFNSWEEKMEACRSCDVFKTMFKNLQGVGTDEPVK